MEQNNDRNKNDGPIKPNKMQWIVNLRKKTSEVWSEVDYYLNLSLTFWNIIDDLKKYWKGILSTVAISALILFLVSIARIAFFALHNSTPKSSDEITTSIGELGTFGDFFGGVTNPIIGLVGFIALAITISLQIKQNKASLKDSFDNSFFNMVNLQSNIISSLNYEGHEARSSFARFITKNDEKLNPDITNKYKLVVKQSAAKVFYKQFNSENNAVFGHYFRNLYRVLKMIHESSNDHAQKIIYSRIIRAQLSMGELTVLFLNCLDDVCDKGEFAFLLKRYQMLEHLSIKKVNSDKIKRENYNTMQFLIGDKVKVSGKEVLYYITEEHGKYQFRQDSGAFGKNRSQVLHSLKLFRSLRQ